MTKQVFNLPDLGEGLTEATLLEWLVDVGDTVKVDQVIAEVETKKSAVELPSPFSGTVAALHGDAGSIIATGAPVIEIVADTDSAEIENYRNEERAGSGNVLIGYGTDAGPEKSRRRRKSATATATVTEQGKPGPKAVRSPIVRRLAKELGVNLDSITPTGNDGVITRKDVLAAATTTKATATKTPETTSAAITAGKLQVLREEPFTALRKAVSEKMTQSRTEIPEATVWVDVDITDLWQLRHKMGSPSLTAIFARFTLLALAEFPLLASRVNESQDSLIIFDGVNLGLAVNTPRGLMVPKVEFANRLNIKELDAAVNALGEEARGGKIHPSKLSGSTFTLNNYGALGVDGSAAIINHPEVAILGIGRAIEKPWVFEGEITVRRIVQLSLVFDHRVCDGGYAAGFLNTIVNLLENPLGAYTRI